jgi:RsiW-degrading membrane proteinase PrsW (M82 family)
MADALSEQHEPRGIGGWLLVPVLWTIVGPALSAYGVLRSAEALIEHAHNQSAVWTHVVIGEAITAIAMTAGSIVALVMLFKHKRSYPSIFITLVVAAFFIGLIDAMIVSNILNQELDSASKRDLGRSFLFMVIWGAYMHESKRVKNTFVN